MLELVRSFVERAVNWKNFISVRLDLADVLGAASGRAETCLLYTSDAADE